MNYLDLTVWIEDGKMKRTLFKKEMNKYSFIEPESCHPQSCFVGTVKGIRKRILSRCPATEDVNKEIKFFYRKLRARGYSHDLLRKFLLSPTCNSRKKTPVSAVSFKAIFTRSVNFKAVKHCLQRPKRMLKVAVRLVFLAQKNLFRLNQARVGG